MPLPVSLQDVIDQIDLQSELVQGFINRKTGELTIFTEEDDYALRHLEDGRSLEELPEWQQEIIPKLREIQTSDDFIGLPTPFEVHEYRIMENFIYSLEDTAMQDDLFRAIRGRGAFRIFKDKIFDHGIRDDWFTFKNNSIKRIAIDFLEAEGIGYVDDCG